MHLSLPQRRAGWIIFCFQKSRQSHGESRTDQHRTTLILPLTSRQQWAVQECHQRPYSRTLCQTWNQVSVHRTLRPSSVRHRPGPCVPPHCPTTGMLVVPLVPLVQFLGAWELPSHLAGSCGTSDSAMQIR